MPAPRVFFDLTIDGEPIGRVIIELFYKQTPITCENFRLLCTSSTLHPTTGTPLTFTACPIHRVIPSFILQTGDITSGDGTGGHSALGEKYFADENLGWRDIDEAGLVCMANRGEDTNSSQWFVTMDDESGKGLELKNTVFGKVVEGMDVLRRVEEVECGDGDRPVKKVEIGKAGELVFKPKAGEAEAEAEEGGVSDERRSRRHEDRSGQRRHHRRRSQSPDHPQRGRSKTGTESPEVERRYRSRSRSRHGHRNHRHGHGHKRRHRSRSASVSRSRSISRSRHGREKRGAERSKGERRGWDDVDMMRDPEEEERIEREERERERGRLEGLPIVEEGGVKFKGRGSMKYREKKRWGGRGQWGGGYGRLD